MINITLSRIKFSDVGSPGLLEYGSQRWYTLELPWRDNIRNKSAIPAGAYHCLFIHTNTIFGDVYILSDVPGRDGILIHGGIYAGNVDLGYKTHSKGCILIGHSLVMSSQYMLLDSLNARSQFQRTLRGESFRLTIINP